MSLRTSPLKFSTGPKHVARIVLLSALIIGLGAGSAVWAASPVTPVDNRLVPPVQNYAEQAVPVPAPQGYYDSPLAAGTLTLQDVLEAHKPNAENPHLPAMAATPSGTATAPMLTPPTQGSSTSLMMSQGMRAVLQKVGETSTGAPVQVRPPSMNGQPLPDSATAQPASLLPGAAATAVATPPVPMPVPVDVGTAPGMKYEPGQEPRSLGAAAGIVAAAAGTATVPLSNDPAASVTATPSAASSASPTQSCDRDVQKWEKSCGDAGYPATYIGKIIGETHSGCADGALHDVWVTNSCAPPDASSAQSPSTDGACGAASNNQFDDAPVANLCAQGISSSVSGTGPWTWACSGVNGGQPAACSAGTRVTPVNAACGSANGAAVSAAPMSDLCASGAPTSVRGSGPWTWSCRGVGDGSTQSCIAPLMSNGASGGVAAMSEPSDVSSSSSAAAIMAAPVAPVPSARDLPEPREAAALAKEKPVAAPKEMAVPKASVMKSSVPKEPKDKGELCGAAAETLAFEAPDKDLCRAGSASVVNGDGPWSWSCTDNEGYASSCRTLSLNGDAAATPAAEAPVAAAVAPAAASPVLADAALPKLTNPGVPAATPAPGTDVACGPAAIQPSAQQPDDELCVNGTASAVKGAGPWRWTCSNKRHHKVVSCETGKPADGHCGAANGATLKSAPFAGLCSAGAPTGMSGTGPWSWSCQGTGGGVDVSCAATVSTAVSRAGVDGTCGASANMNVPTAPVDGLCATGTPGEVNGAGPWTWSCSGTSGGSAASCAANKGAATPAPGPSVNGLCGDANGVTAILQPTDGLCASGKAASVVGNGPWNWSCLGENGGMTVSCTAPLEPPAPIDGVCGDASGNPTLVKPQSGLCSSGITGTVSGRGPWTWTCSGANGGSPASCVAPRAGGKGGALPSLTSSETDGIAPVAPVDAASSNLVTPHLPGASGDGLPALDRKVIPSLTPSKGLSTPVLPSTVPPAASVETMPVPEAIPDLSSDSRPVPPPALRDSLPSAPVLQETAGERAARIPGNHLTLDPTISTVLFARGSSNIDEKVLTTLDRLSDVLLTSGEVRITLTAYADNADSTPRDARRLSLARALAVRDYLASKGVSDSRIDVRAEGANTTSGYIDRVDVKAIE